MPVSYNGQLMSEEEYRKVRDGTGVRTPSGALVDPSTGSLIQAPTDANAPITSATFSSTPTLNIPPTPQNEDLSSLNKSLSGYFSSTPSATETSRSDIQKRVLELTQGVGGKEQYQAEQDKALGVTETSNQLRGLKAQLDSLNLEAQGIPTQIQQEFAGRGVTKGGVAPIEAGRLRENALKSLSLAAQGLVLQGNLANARDLADRAVNIKFAPMENELKYLTAAYLMNKDTLEREDKKKADQLGILITERNRLLTQGKENFSTGQALALAALKNNPGSQAAQMAANQVMALNPSNPKYLQKVYELVGQYQSDPAQVQKDLDAHLLTQAQIDNVRLGAAKFEEDKRQFNLEYALKQEKQRADINAEKVKNEGAGALKENALTSAVELLEKFDAGTGTSAVGGNIQNRLSFIGDWLGKGTGRADFIVQFDNLKSLLSLDNVKYLKGQGQVSDAERRLLEQASAKLDRSQSETEFRSALVDIKNALSGGTLRSPDGTKEVSISDLTAAEIEEAKKAGWK